MKSKNKLVILGDYIEKELEFIEKGILSVIIENELYFIFKSKKSDIQSLQEISEISLDIDPIFRDEFPSIRAIIRFMKENIEYYNIDHYFSLESDKEIEHLQMLDNDKFIKIVFYDTSVCFTKVFDINNEDISKLKNALDQIAS